jgi:sulfite exporter TauE/SafE
MGLPNAVRSRPLLLLPYLLSYNIGRLLSYTAAGLIVGLLSATASHYFKIDFPVGGVVGGLFMLALGIYIGGWYPTMNSLEKLGGNIWRQIEPWGRKLMPVSSMPQALALGLLWGWLPCGLVYSTLAWSAASGSASYSAALMLAFGVGTLPMMLVMGGLAERLRYLTQMKWTRYIAGSVLIAFGGLILFRAFNMYFMGGGHHMH